MNKTLASIICCAATLLTTATANQPLEQPEATIVVDGSATRKINLAADSAALSDNILWLQIDGTQAGELQLAALSKSCTPTIEAVWADGTPLVLQSKNGFNSTQSNYTYSKSELQTAPAKCMAKITFSGTPTDGLEVRVVSTSNSASLIDTIMAAIANFKMSDTPSSYLLAAGIGFLMLLILCVVSAIKGKKKRRICTLTCSLGSVELFDKDLTNNGGYTIGRGSECDWVLDETSISRNHGRLSLTNDGLYYTDLNSSNGTYRNDVELPTNQPVLLTNGDKLELGRIIIQVNIH